MEEGVVAGGRWATEHLQADGMPGAGETPRGNASIEQPMQSKPTEGDKAMPPPGLASLPSPRRAARPAALLSPLGLPPQSDSPSVAVARASRSLGLPCLVNASEDPLLTAALMFPLRLGVTRIGAGGPRANAAQDVRLGGPGMLPEHCLVLHAPGPLVGTSSGTGSAPLSPEVARCVQRGTIVLRPAADAWVSVNGRVAKEDVVLEDGDSIALGGAQHVYVFRRDARRALRPAGPALGERARHS